VSSISDEVLNHFKANSELYKASYKAGYDAGYLAGVNAAKAIFDKHFPPVQSTDKPQ
jgi:hypothetical protein